MKSITEQLIMHEGKRNKVYRDTEGILTIGVGRNLEDKGLNNAEIKRLLANDVKEIKNELQKYKWYQKLSKVRQKVIIDMAFNLGLNGLLSFENMIQAIKDDNYYETAQEMLDSKWAEQVGYRADRLSKMMETGEDYK